MKFDYDLPSDTLVHLLWSALTSAERSKSKRRPRSIIEERLAEAHYYKGVLLARLDDAIPPFRNGQIVRLKRFRRVYTGENCPEPRPGHMYTVSRVWYIQYNAWAISFREYAKYPDFVARFPADSFCKEEIPRLLRLIHAVE